MVPGNVTRLYLDDNVLDRVVGEARDLVLAIAGRGAAVFYSSHTTEDELGAMPAGEAERQRALLADVKRFTQDVQPIPTVRGHGRFDKTLFGDDISIRIYKALTGKHGPRDAIHVATANYVGCDYFVTEDKGLRQDVERWGLTMKPIGFDGMMILLRSL